VKGERILLLSGICVRTVVKVNFKEKGKSVISFPDLVGTNNKGVLVSFEL
jgi:hypothetical protein